MKNFNDFETTFNWVKNIIEQTKSKTIKSVAEESYIDSKEFTYLDTEDMYNSGKKYSEFDKGLVILKAPYVKVRYYIKANGKKNPLATIQWFEATKRKNIKKYSKQFLIELNEIKGG
jgi:hypothetical protein